MGVEFSGCWQSSWAKENDVIIIIMIPTPGLFFYFNNKAWAFALSACKRNLNQVVIKFEIKDNNKLKGYLKN